MSEIEETRELMSSFRPALDDLGYVLRAAREAGATVLTVEASTVQDVLQLIAIMESLLNNPETDNFLDGVELEAAHQRQRWGGPHDREKSSEHWFWLVGYLAGKALHASKTGQQDKAQHHCISSAAALSHWHAFIKSDASGVGVAADADLARLNVPPTME